MYFVLNVYLMLVFFFVENKRKCNDSPSNSQVKTKRFDSNVCIDLIVLGLPWQLTESNLKEYFQTYGNVTMSMVRAYLNRIYNKRQFGSVSTFLFMFVRTSSYQFGYKDDVFIL